MIKIVADKSSGDGIFNPILWRGNFIVLISIRFIIWWLFRQKTVIVLGSDWLVENYKSEAILVIVCYLIAILPEKLSNNTHIS